MPQVVLHWYQASPFAQKLAWALNYKNIDYKTVTISLIEPRPLRRPLDGGYRKTPILQIGNEVFCDTKCIFNELEKRYPEPSLYPTTRSGQPSEHLAKSIQFWLESTLFMMIPSQVDIKRIPAAMQEDRAAFIGKKDLIDASGPYLRAELFAQLEQAQRLIPQNDNSWILDTPTLSAVDLSLAMDSFFATSVLGPDFAQQFPRLPAHMERVTTACRMSRTEEMPNISAEDALAIAKAEVVPYMGSRECVLPLLSVGQEVTVTPIDAGKIPATGKLLTLTTDEIVIEHADPPSGITSIIHFPTIGFVVMPLQGKL